MKNIEEVIEKSKNLKILYVEDNNEVRESTLLILKEFFEDIVVGVDGADGLEKFNKDIEIVLTDINMPRMNGIEMAQEILKIKEVSMLFLTAHNEIEFFQKSLELHADGYLLKPFDIDTFVSLLSKIIKEIELKREKKRYLILLKQYEDVTNRSSIVSKTDTKGIITYVNDNFCKISGYTKEELLGKPHNIVRHPDMPKSAFRDMWHTIKSKKTWVGVVKNRTKKGNAYYVKATVAPILNEDGEIIEYIALRHDIGEIIGDKKQLFDFLEVNKLSVILLIQIEDYDVLERFYNRTVVEDIEDDFRQALMLLLPSSFCDFQRVYKLGNGLYGFAQNRKKCQLSVDELYEKISLFMDNIKSYVVKIENEEYDIEYDISAVCSFTFGVFNIYEDAKIGIQKALDEKKTIVYADSLYDLERRKAKENIQTIQFIKKAIESNKIVSFLQPIVKNGTLEVEKYESLVRLINEDRDILLPSSFLDVARKGRYYKKITKITLKNSFEALEKYDKEISINLSLKDIESKSIKQYVYNLLEEYKNDTDRVVFELLESEDVKNFELIKEFIYHVKDAGVQIAIDDFGTGFSNFERLLQYEPDILKIDGSLIKEIKENKVSRDIVETVVLFAKKQNLKTVAEFVENEDIFKCVKEMEIEYSQGYYFGKPFKIE